MFREFFYLLAMEFKQTKAYLPVALFFSVIFPIGILIAFGYITSSPFKTYIISGTIAFYISIGTTLSVAQTIANEREVGRISLISASGIPRELYILSIAISNGITTLLIVPILLIAGSLLLHIVVASPTYLIISILSSIFMGMMFGTLIGFGFRTLREVNQYSQIISFGLA
ncbi:ABC transporter permease, partial [Acidianus sp. RZ1]